jgi:hypothetical protein
MSASSAIFSPSSSTNGHNHLNAGLSLDQVRNFAPSAFAPAPHESRSDRYAYIPTSEVINGLVREGFVPFKASQSLSRIDGKQAFTKHMLRFRHRDAHAVNALGSIPEVILINSHDGSSAYKLFAGVFRFVCSNGLIVADSTVGSISIQHKGNVVDRVIEGSIEIINDSKKSLATIEAWSQVQLNQEEQLALATAAHSVRFADAEGEITTPIQPSQLLTVHRQEDNANDLWVTFNRIQEGVTRGGLRARGPRVNGRRGRAVTTRTITGIDQDLKLNRALWSLAEKMAELKAAA